MNILAVDTSTKDLVLALQTSEEIYMQKSAQSLQHSKILFSDLECLLRKAGTLKDELDIIAVNLGPGSFTGIRIGACFAKGMNYALKTNLVGADAFEAIAEAGKELLPAGILCEERNGGGYFAVAKLQNGEVEICNRGVYKREEIARLMDEKSLKRILSESKTPSVTHEVSGALGLIKLAEKASLKGEYLPCEQLEPVYIKKSQAEEQLLEKEKKNASANR